MIARNNQVAPHHARPTERLGNRIQEKQQGKGDQPI